MAAAWRRPICPIDPPGRREEDPKRVEEATSMTVGTAIVTPDGRAWFNGVALHDVEQEALLQRCRDALASR
jgi:hypothetical protein